MPSWTGEFKFRRYMSSHVHTLQWLSDIALKTFIDLSFDILRVRQRGVWDQVGIPTNYTKSTSSRSSSTASTPPLY
jgi:hypothetical protein